MDFTLTKEHRDIINAAKEFAEGEFPDHAQEFDREESFDYDIWKRACELGFVGINIKEEYGGAGMGLFDLCLVTEEFYAADAGMALAIMSPTFGLEILELFGTEEQKRKYLSPLAAGEAKMGTAITEPDAGSDTAAATTTAVKDGDEYIVNGSKMFITNGCVADYLAVFCQTNPDNPNRHRRHSFIMVETDREGYEANKLHGKLGIRASDTAEVSFSNVRVPVDNLVGVEGNGFKELMAFFDLSRIFVTAQAVGVARSAMEEAVTYAKSRHQFGQALASFQTNQFKIAEMATHIKAARNLVYEAAWKADHDMVDSQLIAMAKWFAAETAVKCADESLQIHGGYGYIDEYKIQRIYRDAKIMEIYEGTKEIEKIIISRSIIGK
jgi:alkylation response protein AidB-like acyl-CoA dehydrogenase